MDPNIPGDIETVHALQHGVKIEQPGGPGKFEIPKCDPVSQKKVRDALIGSPLQPSQTQAMLSRVGERGLIRSNA